MVLETEKTTSLPKLDRFAGLGVFFLSFAVYLLTLAPTVTFWDCGELICGAVSLGNSHPPSYLLFCTLGKGFSFLPLGNAAYRVNLLAATAAAAAVYMLFRLIAEMGSGRPGAVWVAAGLALCFAFIRNLWSVSVLSEMYSLNALMLIATAYLLLLYEREGRHAFLHASAFLLGLALVNHQSALMFLPAYAVYYISSGKNYEDPKLMLQSLCFFILGYSIILYLPIRAAESPVINIGDPKTLPNFLWEVKWPENIAMIKSLTWGVALRMKEGRLLYPMLAVVVCGSLIYILRKRRYALMLTLSALLYYVGTGMVTAPETGMRKWGLYSKFYVPVYLFIGLTAVAALFHFWAKRPDRKTYTAAGNLFLAVVCLSFPLGVMAYNYDDVDNSRNFFAYDFASNTLKSVRQDAAVFAWGDNGIFPVWYLQGVERFRDDVFFIHTEILTYPWYMADRQSGLNKKYGIWYASPYSLSELKFNVGKMRLVLEKVAPTYFDFSAAAQLDYKLELLNPQGLVHLVSAWEAVPDGRIWDRYVLRGAFDGTTNKAFVPEGILDIYSWECGVWMQEAYSKGRPEEALRAYGLARDLGLRNEYLDRWAEGVKKSLERR